MRLWFPAGVVLGLVGALVGSASAAPLVAYDDQLRNGFVDWSWATHDLTQTQRVHSGATAISMEPDGWAATYFHRDAGVDVSVYDTIELWVRGAGSGGQSLSVAVTAGGEVVGSAGLAGFIEGGSISGSAWRRARIPLSALEVEGGVLDGLWFQDATGGNQSAVYLDDISFLERTGSVPPTPTPANLTIQINPDADRRPIDPRIYGVNFGEVRQLAQLHFPVRRWGGNAVTRYSWEDDISNRASDWFYYNIENANSNPSELPNNSASDRFVAETFAADSEPLITVPTIGWTPRDRSRRWGFSVQKYGAQQQTECTAAGGADWCQPDAGNGVRANGSPVTGNDPRDTSRAIAPSFVTRWIQHLGGRAQTLGHPRVRFYALDNEPALWNSTHRDVHPEPLSYDELWQRTLDYASAMKTSDPNALILGPADWGWCAYFGSAVDATIEDGTCLDGPDRQAHGGVPLIPWYLQQVAAHRTSTGVQLVDYLDIHYYPQASGVALSGEGAAAVQERRLRTVKSLYDPSYTDESWIGEPVRLIPRMKEWIAQNAPGLKLAITEYNWGNDDSPTGALAQAEVLAVFGREGVDLATRWVAPEPDSLVEDAFRMYLDYDGQGSRIIGDSVRALSSNIDDVGAYAVRWTSQSGDQLFTLMFNKSTGLRSAAVTVTGGVTGPVQLFRFTSTSRLGSAGVIPATPNGFTVQLPARSATLAIVGVGAGEGTPLPAQSMVGLFVLAAWMAVTRGRRHENSPGGMPHPPRSA